MEKIKINYKELVLTPLLSLSTKEELKEISLQDLIVYKSRIESISKELKSPVKVLMNMRTIKEFETGYKKLISITKEDGNTYYTLLKNSNITEAFKSLEKMIDPEALDIMLLSETLEVFTEKNTKKLTKKHN